MTDIRFALNHITAPKLGCRDFATLAAGLGCAGIELRNDLADKQLTGNAFFDGEDPADVGTFVRSEKLELLGLSEVYGFNRWSEEMKAKVKMLIAQAKAAGAGTISLIPSNDGAKEPTEKRLADLRHALTIIRPMLEAAGLVALVEPLGFTTSSLRSKREAVEAIDAVGGNHCYRLVHDTFHHFLAGETEFFPEMTGIVHISGVVDPAVSPDAMTDAHRVFVTADDRLGNIAQIRDLVRLGYKGAYSFELFSPEVHADPHLRDNLATSIQFIRDALGA